MIEFLNDDEDYLSWIATTHDGFVLNVRRRPWASLNGYLRASASFVGSCDRSQLGL